MIAAQLRCRRCATIIRNNRVVCPSCGLDVQAQAAAAPPAMPSPAGAPASRPAPAQAAKPKKKMCPVCMASMLESEMVECQGKMMCPSCEQTFAQKPGSSSGAGGEIYTPYSSGDKGPELVKRKQVEGITLVAKYHHGRHSHPEMLDGVAEALLKATASFYGKGPSLADGVTIAFGWMTLTMRQIGSELVLCEPDFSKPDPRTAYIENVSFTLQVSFMQTLTYQLTKIRQQNCSCYDLISVAKGALSQKRLAMMRDKVSNGNSAWLIWPEFDVTPHLNKHPDEVLKLSNNYFDTLKWDAMPCYELAKHRPHLLKVVGLPVGCKAFFEGDKVTDVLDPNGDSCLPE